MEEFTTVKLKKPLPHADIPVGSIGTVVMIRSSSPPAYEVEFFDAEDHTIRDTRSGVFTFTTNDEYIEEISEAA